MYKINLVNKANGSIKYVANTEEDEDFYNILKILIKSLKASKMKNSITIENDECTILIDEPEKRVQLLLRVIELINNYTAWDRIVIFNLNPIKNLNEMTWFIEDTKHTHILILHEKDGFIVIRKINEE